MPFDDGSGSRMGLGALAAAVAAVALPVAATVAILSLTGTHSSVGYVPSGAGPAPRVIEKTLPAPTTIVIPAPVQASAPAAPASTSWSNASGCEVVGDSLAVGSADALRSAGVECGVSARQGAGSGEILASMPDRVDASSIVLSAGVNDGVDPDTYANLRAIRARLFGRVVWLLPVREPARTLVEQVCGEAGDGAIDLTPFVGGDGVHPDDMSGYAAMMAQRDRPSPCTAVGGT